MADYFLPRHVHFCCRGDALVFLDLKQDDYTLVSGPMAAVIRALSSGVAVAQTPDDETMLRELIEGGLLTTDGHAGKDILPTRIAPALDPLIEPERRQAASVTLKHVSTFMRACSMTALRLRSERIERIVTSVERRKVRAAHAADFPMEQARILTTAFLKLRALFPRNYLCLYDSLALVEFLAHFGVFPTWVFGVKLEPWAAHCWVQERSFMFNEDVEEAAGYTPVMAV